MSDELHLGYETAGGTAESIPLFHTVVTGITRHGKSETMNALAERANAAGYTVLIFDVKNPRDYGDVGADIPIYLEEHTDPTTLKGLLENQSGMGLNFQFSELIKMYEPGDTYHDMLDRMAAAMDEDVHPVEEDKLRVLVHLLESLTEELDRVDIADTLEVTSGAINVMDLHAVDSAIQQLAIAGSVETVLEAHQDVIIILDEAHNFIPQRKQPPARDSLVRLIREGAANNNWLWISDQTITGVDKDPLKQVGVWILGKQREKNEAKRVLDQIPGSTSYGTDDVMTLETGHFIVALDSGQPLVYVQPTWMDDAVAEAIATGDRDVSTLETPEPEDTDMDETLQEKEAELQAKEQRITELEEQLAARNDEIQALEAKIDAVLGGEEQPQPTAEATVDEATIEAVVEEYIETLEVPESIAIEETVPQLVVTRTVEPMSVDTESTIGRILTLYAEGELPTDRWLTTGNITNRLEAAGYDENVAKDDLDKLCRLGLMRMQWSGNRPDYQFRMSPEEAQAEGLLHYETITPT